MVLKLTNSCIRQVSLGDKSMKRLSKPSLRCGCIGVLGVEYRPREDSFYRAQA